MKQSEVGNHPILTLQIAKTCRTPFVPSIFPAPSLTALYPIATQLSWLKWIDKNTVFLIVQRELDISTQKRLQNCEKPVHFAPFRMVSDNQFPFWPPTCQSSPLVSVSIDAPYSLTSSSVSELMHLPSLTHISGRPRCHLGVPHVGRTMWG